MKLDQRDVFRVAKRIPECVKTIMESCRFPGLFIAGGFIRSVIAKEEPSDIDVFSTSAESLEKVKAEIESTWEGTWVETENARTFISQGALPIQLVNKWLFSHPSDCVEHFDLTIAQAAMWFSGEWKSASSDDYYHDLAAKRLVYTGSDVPGGTLLRVMKFIRRGYTIDVGNLAPIISDLTGADHDRVFEDLREVDPSFGADVGVL